MKIDYASSAMAEEDFVLLFEKSLNPPGQQAQKFNRLMLQGLAENNVSVRAVTARPVTGTNCKKKYLTSQNVQRKKVRYHYCSVLNVRGIKIIWQIITSFFTILRGNCDAVVVDVLNASVAYGAVMAAHVRRRPCVGIITDLPELMVTGTNQKHAKMVRKIIKKCTAYVLLTEAMNDSVNLTNKPYVIVEALCDSTVSPLINKKKENKWPKICMYAGLLDARYGVKDMVEGFVLADMKEVELHIYGNGSYSDELKKIAQEHSNVIYHGIAMNNEVVRAEMEADLLINPRPTHEEFTKYSFPSKNMEYMVSGTPVLTTDLPGMPEDYKSYVYLIEKEDSTGIAKALKKVFSLEENVRDKRGKDAQQYVLQYKNNIAQSKKVLHLIEKI